MECFYFHMPGGCHWGDTCSSTHTPGDEGRDRWRYARAATAGEASRRIVRCRFFSHPSQCRYGAACMRLHSGDLTPIRRSIETTLADSDVLLTASSPLPSFSSSSYPSSSSNHSSSSSSPSSSSSSPSSSSSHSTHSSLFTHSSSSSPSSLFTSSSSSSPSSSSTHSSSSSYPSSSSTHSTHSSSSSASSSSMHSLSSATASPWIPFSSPSSYSTHSSSSSGSSSSSSSSSLPTTRSLPLLSPLSPSVSASSIFESGSFSSSSSSSASRSLPLLFPLPSNTLASAMLPRDIPVVPVAFVNRHSHSNRMISVVAPFIPVKNVVADDSKPIMYRPSPFLLKKKKDVSRDIDQSRTIKTTDKKCVGRPKVDDRHRFAIVPTPAETITHDQYGHVRPMALASPCSVRSCTESVTRYRQDRDRNYCRTHMRTHQIRKCTLCGLYQPHVEKCWVWIDDCQVDCCDICFTNAFL